MRNFWLSQIDFAEIFLEKFEIYTNINNKDPSWFCMRSNDFFNHWNFFKFVIKSGMNVKFDDNPEIRLF